jgi:hypothetical protein
MKLLSYKEFVNENYLPYFGVKQAIDDSYNKGGVNHLIREKISDFNRIYSMTPQWWEAWKRENIESYQISQDAFSKTYEVKKDGVLVFVFDYGRNKIFTNQKPDIFTIKKEISPEELEKIKSANVENPDKKQKMEEDLQSDPNRTVGTGTYTSTTTYPNSVIGGYFNSTDSASGGSIPVYTS